jgi:2',3'-cyclic-nucleotide 2'-phosphodiesterase (5'-nucleotidase family)
MKLHHLTIVFIALLALSACGAKSYNIAAPGSSALAPGVVSVSDGLNVSFGDNEGQWIIPANAVAADTEYQIVELDSSGMPDADRLRSAVFEFRPTDLVFSEPATIKFTLPNPLPAGAASTIARLSDGAWEIIASVSNGTTISGSTSRSGSYALISKPPRVAAKTLGPACDVNATNQTVRFVHVADLHSRFGYQEQLYSRIKTLHKQALADQPYTIFTNGGDDFEKGTVAEVLSSGEATIEATKAMAFDVRVVGNHDYAWGPEQLLDYAQDDHAIVLASNTWYTGSNGEFAAVEFATLQVGCIKMGFFGMTSVPWNELDQPFNTTPIPDFIPDFSMNWSRDDVAQAIVDRYRSEVDYMVMLSHMGFGSDKRLVADVNGVDLVLGGHTHGGESFETLTSGTVVVQPEFYADGVTEVNLNFDLSNKTVVGVGSRNYVTRDVAVPDADMVGEIDQIMGRYAPDASTEVAVAEKAPDKPALAAIALAAAQYVHGGDAIILNPALVTKLWLPGSLTQEDFLNSFRVERQPSNTPGFNSLYSVQVSGSELEQMVAAQPSWLAKVPEQIVANDNYTLILTKGPALNIAMFFQGLPERTATALSETWFALDQYARNRTSQCLHIDTDTQLAACAAKDRTTIWQFDNNATPLAADSGSSVLSFYDPSKNGGSLNKTSFDTTKNLNISDLPDGEAVVMSFPAFTSNEGLALKHNLTPNGGYASDNEVSNYTVVMDVLWPAGSDGKFRALLQTNSANTDDADIFVEGGKPSGGFGIATAESGYFGVIEPDKWYRLGLVFFAAPENGTLKVYIDGVLVGEKAAGDIDKRWSLTDVALLLTDDTFETEPGYLNALLFSGRALTDQEVESLAGPSKKLIFSPDVRELNQKVIRHYESAPESSHSD